EDILVVPQEIKGVIVKEGRGNIRSHAVELPRDLGSIGNVAFCSDQADGQHGLPVVTVPCEDHAAARDRRGYHVAGKSGAFQELSASGKIIAADALGRADAHLRLAFMLDGTRWGSGG